MKHLSTAFLLLFFFLTSCKGGERVGLKRPSVPQDRNGPCMRDKDCLAGLMCEGERKEAPGTCQKVCQSDRDCGEGMLCREGSCQADCAGLNEKCSERRVCCFSDRSGDGVSDLACTKDEAGDLRCLLPKPPPAPTPQPAKKAPR